METRKTRTLARILIGCLLLHCALAPVTMADSQPADWDEFITSVSTDNVVSLDVDANDRPVWLRHTGSSTSITVGYYKSTNYQNGTASFGSVLSNVYKASVVTSEAAGNGMILVFGDIQVSSDPDIFEPRFYYMAFEYDSTGITFDDPVGLSMGTVFDPSLWFNSGNCDDPTVGNVGYATEHDNFKRWVATVNASYTDGEYILMCNLSVYVVHSGNTSGEHLEEHHEIYVFSTDGTSSYAYETAIVPYCDFLPNVPNNPNLNVAEAVGLKDGSGYLVIGDTSSTIGLHQPSGPDLVHGEWSFGSLTVPVLSNATTNTSNFKLAYGIDADGDGSVGVVYKQSSTVYSRYWNPDTVGTNKWATATSFTHSNPVRLAGTNDGEVHAVLATGVESYGIYRYIDGVYDSRMIMTFGLSGWADRLVFDSTADEGMMYCVYAYEWEEDKGDMEYYWDKGIVRE